MRALVDRARRFRFDKKAIPTGCIDKIRFPVLINQQILKAQCGNQKMYNCLKETRLYPTAFQRR